MVPMPATDYEIRDALEKVKIPDGGSITMEVTQFDPEMKFLAEHTETEICDLSTVFRMNALVWQSDYGEIPHVTDRIRGTLPEGWKTVPEG